MMMTTAPVFAAQGFSGPSATQNQTQTQQGGFVDNNANLTTAAKVKDLKDDAGEAAREHYRAPVR